MQRLQHCFRMGLGDAEDGAGGSFGTAVVLLILSPSLSAKYYQV